MKRHRWGEKTRMAQKSEVQCLDCELMKATLKERNGRFVRYRVEFWRGTDRVECTATPACEKQVREAA